MKHHIKLAALGALWLYACGQPETNSTKPVAPQTPLHVNVLDCGQIDVLDLDGFSTAGDYAGQSDTFSSPCFLVRHPEGTLLWDLGLPGMLAGLGDQNLGGVFNVSLEKTVTQRVEALGLNMDDIDFVSVSHHHFDHIGQIPQIDAATTWLVNEVELGTMFPESGELSDKIDPGAAAMFPAFTALQKKSFSGNHDVFGDGSVVIIPMPGHTPGHSVLHLTLPETGAVLLTGDLFHRRESRLLKRVPRFNFDETQTLSSMAAFDALADELNAQVIIQHEPDHISPLNGVIR